MSVQRLEQMGGALEHVQLMGSIHVDCHLHWLFEVKK